jgi:tRNA/tmRNA/rRNA uracil-C5-methylase (TrmA/RlmC/RlmD family)
MAKCPYFGLCGGCSLQHIPYELTLENKKKFVEDNLRKNGYSLETIELQHGEEYNYRNRMDFAFSPAGLGLREQSHFDRHVHIKTCDISNAKINALMKDVQDWFDKNKNTLEPFDIRRKEGVLKFALMRAPENTDETTLCFALNINSTKAAEHMEKIKEFSKSSSAKNIIIAKVEAQREDSTSNDFFTVKGSEMIEEEFLGKKLLYHSQGFFQNNTKVAEMMVKKAREIFEKAFTSPPLAKDSNIENKTDSGDVSKVNPKSEQGAEVGKGRKENITLLDLYGGVGTFGINLADLFSKTIILESVGPSIECAKLNIEKNNLKNAEAIVGDASRMNKVTNASGDSLYVVTDPPRSGMEQKAILHLLEMNPKIIIYVSCNPAQFAKELKFFSKKYELVSMTVFDMFPQTNHIETMAELRRK